MIFEWTCREVKERAEDPDIIDECRFDFMDEEALAGLDQHIEKCAKCRGIVWGGMFNKVKENLITGIENDPEKSEVEKTQIIKSFSQRVEEIKNDFLINSGLKEIWIKIFRKSKSATPFN